MVFGYGTADRAQPRFPLRLAETVKDAIKAWLQERNVQIGFSSAACGSDILFQEALAELGGERHIVLPYGEDEFIQDSVSIVSNGDWERRFYAVKQGAQVVYASQHRILTGGPAFEYGNLVLQGLAELRASELGMKPVGLVVWDGQAGDGLRGTASWPGASIR